MLLAGVHVALRVNRDAADGEELSRVTSTAAERADRRERVALQDVDLLVVAVGDEHVALLGVIREREIPRRAMRRDDAELSGDRRAERVLRHDGFLHERAIFAKYLDAIAAAVADIDLAVARDVDAGDVAERLCRRIV